MPPSVSETADAAVVVIVPPLSSKELLFVPVEINDNPAAPTMMLLLTVIVRMAAAPEWCWPVPKKAILAPRPRTADRRRERYSTPVPRTNVI